jgi:hypothetical protein
MTHNSDLSRVDEVTADDLLLRLEMVLIRYNMEIDNRVKC